MAFNADEYIGVIVEQIGGNFIELYNAVRKRGDKICLKN